MKTTDTTNNQTAPFAPREAHQQAEFGQMEIHGKARRILCKRFFADV